MLRFVTMATLVLMDLPACANDALDVIGVEPDFTGKPCERAKNFGRWIYADRDGENAREEVLIAESMVPVTRYSKGKVDAGLWLVPMLGLSLARFIQRGPNDVVANVE